MDSSRPLKWLWRSKRSLVSLDAEWNAAVGGLYEGGTSESPQRRLPTQHAGVQRGLEPEHGFWASGGPSSGSNDEGRAWF